MASVKVEPLDRRSWISEEVELDWIWIGAWLEQGRGANSIFYLNFDQIRDKRHMLSNLRL